MVDTRLTAQCRLTSLSIRVTSPLLYQCYLGSPQIHCLHLDPSSESASGGNQNRTVPHPWLCGMHLEVFLYLSVLRVKTEYSVKLVGSGSLSCPMSKTHLCGSGPCSQMGHQTTYLQSSPGAGLSFGRGHVSLLNTCQWPLEPVPQGCSEIDQKLK